MKIPRALAFWTLTLALSLLPGVSLAGSDGGSEHDPPPPVRGAESGSDGPAGGGTTAASHAGPERPAGIRHTLERGMTLGLLARTYGVPVKRLMEANGISDPARIPAGTPILIPGALERLPVGRPAVQRDIQLDWPLRGPVSSPFGSSPTRKRHAGIDIAADPRTPIRAAAGGTVVRVADNARYGLMLVIRHENGYATWYGHTSALLVGKGDTVSRGQAVALVGETGNARGTHLHFEVRHGNVPVNPLPLLKRTR